MARGRNVINQSIQLEGGDEIIKLLKKMGTEGEAAARKLETAFGKVEVRRGIQASFDRLKTSFGKLQEAGGKVSKSFGNVTASVGKVSGAFAAARGKVLLYTAALSGAAVGAAAFVNASLNRIDDLGDLAASIGTNTRALQGLEAAGAEAGLAGNDFVKMVAGLSDSLTELQDKTGGVGRSFTQISAGFEVGWQNGVKITRGIMGTAEASKEAAKEADKLSPKALALQKILNKVGIPTTKKLVPIEVVKAIAKAFSSMKDGAEKTQLAIDIFGAKLGPKLIPFLNMGENAIEQYAQKYEDLGALLSDKEIADGGAASDAVTKLTRIFTQFADKLTAQFAPDITNAVDQIFGALQANAADVKQFIAQTGKAIGTLISDITKLAVGNRAGIENKWIVTLYEWIVKASTAAQEFYNGVLVPGFEAVSRAAEPVAAIINQFLGTKMTGTDVVIVGILFQLVGGFKLLFSVIGLGLNSIDLLIKTLGLIPAFGGLIVDAFGLAARGLLNFGSLLPALAGMLGPAGLIALAVAGLGLLIYAFWDDIVAFTRKAFTFIVDAAAQGWEGVKAVSSAIWDGMKAIYADTWEGIKTVAADALTAV